MDVTTETLSPTRVRLNVTVPFIELKPSIDKAYKLIGRDMRVPGFRPGKVPATFIDQRVGRGAVLNEALQEAMPALYDQAMRQAEADVLGRPELDVTSFEDNQTLTFTAEVEVRPTFELPDFEGLEIAVDDADVSDEDVDKQVLELRQRVASLVDVERLVETGDTITVDLSASVEGEDVPGATATGLSHEVGAGRLIEGLDTAVVGAEVGVPVTFTTMLVAGEQAGKEAVVTAVVQGVKEKVLPDLDDAFADRIASFTSVDELLTDVRERLERNKRLEQGIQARDKVLDAMLAATEVPVPEGVVTGEVDFRERQATNEIQHLGVTLDQYLTIQGQKPEEWRADLQKAAERAVKAQLVLDAVVAKEEIDVQQDELTEHLMRKAQQSGMSPQDYVQQLSQDPNAVQTLMSEVVRGKALAIVLENAVVTDASGRTVDLSLLDADLGGGDFGGGGGAQDSFGRFAGDPHFGHDHGPADTFGRAESDPHFGHDHA